MPFLTLEQAEIICDKAMEKGVELGFTPLTVAVFDAGGALRVLKQPDPASVTRPHMALGKAWGAYAMGQSTRTIAQRHQNIPDLVNTMNLVFGGRIVPMQGGILIRDDNGEVVGTVAAAGDRPQHDEACAIAGVRAAGLVPDPADPDGVEI